MDQFYMQDDVTQTANAPSYAVVGKKAEEEFRRIGHTDGGFAVLHNGKVTFGGKCFVKKGSNFEEQRVNWTASANEIISCSYTKYRSKYHLILAPVAILSAIAFPILIFCAEDTPAALALFPFFGFSFLAFNSLFRFFRGRKRFFEIQLNGVSFCYDTERFEKDEEIPFRLAVQKSKVARIDYPVYPQPTVNNQL